MDKIWRLKLKVKGEHLEPGSIFTLLSDSSDAALRAPHAPIPAFSYDPGARGDKATLRFSKKDLGLGLYSLHAKNPGGLSDSIETLEIKELSPYDIMLSLYYAPLLSFPNSYLNKYYDWKYLPAGYSARIGAIVHKKGLHSFGFEISPSVNVLYSETRTYETYGNLISAHLNFLYQFWIPGRVMAVSARLGAGLSIFQNFHYVYWRTGVSENRSAAAPSLIAGVSFEWLAASPFFVDIGMDFVHIFSSGRSAQQYFRPAIGIGWRW
jgi:hypothetical protein